MALFESKSKMNDLVISYTPHLKRLMQCYSIIIEAHVWKPIGNEQQASVTIGTFLSKEETIKSDGSRELCDPIDISTRIFTIPANIIEGDLISCLYPWAEFDIVRAALFEKRNKNPKISNQIDDEINEALIYFVNNNTESIG